MKKPKIAWLHHADNSYYTDEQFAEEIKIYPKIKRSFIEFIEKEEFDAALAAAGIHADEHRKSRDKIITLLQVVDELRSKLTHGKNSPRELCALMSEGEGSNVEVYRIMASGAMRRIDEAIADAHLKIKELGDK